jgi:alpha-L-fucosidase 2
MAGSMSSTAGRIRFLPHAPSPKGRDVTVATQLLGTAARGVDDQLEFTLKPGAKVRLVTAVLSGIDAPRHLESAKSRVPKITPAEIDKLNAAHREWWTHFWSESYVEIGDPLIEKFYYGSQYVIASASRTGKVAPGLYTPWVTTDRAGWNGDYTLNYNFETPYLALYSSNHIAITDSYDGPVLAFAGRAKLYSGTMLNIRGSYFPAHIGPWGIDRDSDHDPFMGQKSDAAFLALPHATAHL